MILFKHLFEEFQMKMQRSIHLSYPFLSMNYSGLVYFQKMLIIHLLVKPNLTFQYFPQTIVLNN